MTPFAGQQHFCNGVKNNVVCGKRLPVDNVEGSVIVICPRCHAANSVVVIGRFMAREVG